MPTRATLLHADGVHRRCLAVSACVDELRELLPTRAPMCASRPRSRGAIVVLATKEPHCLGDLLLRHAEGDIPAKIEAVVSNHADARSVSCVASTFRSITFSHEGLRPRLARARDPRPCSSATIPSISCSRSTCACCRPDVRRALRGTDHQHPPLLPPGLRRRAPVSAGVRSRREDHRRHGAHRHRRPRYRTDHRAGRAAR